MTTGSTITPELLDQLLVNYEKPEDLTEEDRLFKQLKKALIERALGAERTDHLGYEKGDPAGCGTGNSRNGSSSKTILTEDGEIEIAVPRDRTGSFEPQLIAKGQTRFDGFGDKILSLYYTTNAVEALHRSLRKIIKTRDSFPTDDAALKLLYLAIKNAGLRWRQAIKWTAAMSQFGIQFGERLIGLLG
jgi:transposase-like protein